MHRNYEKEITPSTAQKKKFDLVTATEEILNGKLHVPIPILHVPILNVPIHLKLI